MLDRLREKLTFTLLVLKESAISFRRNNSLDSSAALAYYGFFSLIPLLLLVIYILSNYIVSSASALKLIDELAADLFPEFSKVIIKELHSLSKYKKIWGTVSIITLFWSITPLTSALRNSFSKIFRTDSEISFYKATLRDGLAVLIVLVLFTFLVLSEIIYDMSVGTFLKELPFFLKISNAVAPFIITVVFVYFFFLAFVPVKLRSSNIITGAALTALLWSVIRPLFSLFLKYNPTYGFAFGSLKAIFILIIWVYYTIAVLLFAAEVMAANRKRDTLLIKKFLLGGKLPQSFHKIILDKFVTTYNTNDFIFKEGDRGENMFQVLTGAVAVIKGGQVLKAANKGEYFGEMAMLLDVPRTADAIAVEDDTRIISINKNNFEFLLHEDPKLVLSFLKEMAKRLRNTSMQV
ncbi:MAG: YihY family inner membrane protein [Nitrospirae bacterium]|nr:MAG: YihY family inner membrane protein [Nitrospirota bacterium]